MPPQNNEAAQAGSCNGLGADRLTDDHFNKIEARQDQGHLLLAELDQARDRLDRCSALAEYAIELRKLTSCTLVDCINLDALAAHVAEFTLAVRRHRRRL